MEVKPGYKLTDVGVIPEEWGVRRLSDVGNVVRGSSPRPAGDPRYFNGSFMPWLTVAALTNIPESQLEVSEAHGCLTKEGALQSRTLQPNTLIIANSGATLGVAKLLTITCCANDGIAALLNHTDGDKRFLCCYLNTQTKRLREAVATGNGQPNLNTTLIGNIVVPWPPLPEQRAIAAALSDVDALVGSLDRLVAKKRNLKQAVMRQLLTGQTRLPGFKQQPERRQTEIGLVPGEWEIVTVDAAGEVLGGRQRSPHQLGKLTKYLRVANVFDGYIDTSDVLEMPFTANEKERYLLKHGDILLNEGQSIDLVGRSAVYRGTPADCCYQNTLIRFRSNSQTHTNYAQLVFQSFLSRGVFASIASQTTSIAHLGTGRFALLKFARPPLAEQTAIAEVLSDMDAEIAALEDRRNKTRLLKEGMMQELLAGRIRLV